MRGPWIERSLPSSRVSRCAVGSAPRRPSAVITGQPVPRRTWAAARRPVAWPVGLWEEGTSMAGAARLTSAKQALLDRLRRGACTPWHTCPRRRRGDLVLCAGAALVLRETPSGQRSVQRPDGHRPAGRWTSTRWTEPWAGLVRRHAVLRTTFPLVAGRLFSTSHQRSISRSASTIWRTLQRPRALGAHRGRASSKRPEVRVTARMPVPRL